MRRLRAAGFAVVCGLWLGWSGAARAELEDEERFSDDAYPGSAFVGLFDPKIPSEDRTPLAYQISTDSLMDVVRYFRRQWSLRGLLVAIDGDFERYLVVSAFDTRAALERSVVVRTQGRTTVILHTRRNLDRLFREARPHNGSVTVSETGLGGLAKVRTQVREGDVGAVARALKAEWSAQGFREDTEATQPRGEVYTLVVRRGREQVTTVLTPVDGELTGVVEVREGEERNARQETGVDGGGGGSGGFDGRKRSPRGSEQRPIGILP